MINFLAKSDNSKYFSFFVKKNLKQAGAELCQAQFKSGIAMQEVKLSPCPLYSSCQLIVSHLHTLSDNPNEQCLIEGKPILEIPNKVYGLLTLDEQWLRNKLSQVRDLPPLIWRICRHLSGGSAATYLEDLPPLICRICHHLSGSLWK